MWWQVLPTWLPWLLASLAGLVTGFLIGFWLGEKDRASEVRFLHDQINGLNATIGHLYRDGERRTARLVTGGNDAA